MSQLERERRVETLETASVYSLKCTDIGPDPHWPILMTEREEVRRVVGKLGGQISKGWAG